LKPKEFKLWQDRLRFAKGVWTRKGLIGTDEASTMRLLIELNRGNQWAHLSNTFGDLDPEFYATANKVFPIANSIEGEVAARNPRVQVFPNVPKAAKIASPIEHLINFDIDELNFKRQNNATLKHHLWAPFGVTRHGFTPREEFETDDERRLQLYRPAKPDRPWIRNVPIWDVLMDPTQRSFHVDDGMWWVAFRDIMWLEDIKDNPNMISRDDLKDFAGNISPEWQQMKTPEFDADDDPDKENYVEVFTVYESRDRTWFQMTLDGLDKTLRKRDDWPIPWETLPVSIFQVNEQADTPFPLAIMDEVPSVQIEINRLRTMMGQLVFRLRRLIVYDSTKIDDDEANKIQDAAIMEMIRATGLPGDAIAAISSGVFPQELVQYYEMLLEELRELTGQSKMGRGQRINVESASEATFVQQGQDVNTARISDAFEDHNRDVIRLYMQGRRATMDVTGDELVRIVGEVDADGLQQWVTVTPEDLHADYGIQVVHGSTRKRDKAAEAQAAAIDLQVAQAAPDIFRVNYFARKFLEARGIPPEQGMTAEALVAAKIQTLDQIRRNAQVGEEGPAQPGFSPDVAALSSGNGDTPSFGQGGGGAGGG